MAGKTIAPDWLNEIQTCEFLDSCPICLSAAFKQLKSKNVCQYHKKGNLVNLIQAKWKNLTRRLKGKYVIVANPTVSRLKNTTCPH